MSVRASQIAGFAAGVPYVAVPPERGSASAPVVIAWHLMDAPRTEAAFAAALPLRGLDAWRIYLGLPMCGSREPAGGAAEVMRLGYEDAVLNVHGPVVTRAAAEFGPALEALRSDLDLSTDPVGLLGGSNGAAVAQLVMAECDVEVAAAVLVSPVVQLYQVVETLGRCYGLTYPWTERSRAIARRLDFVGRCADFARHGDPAVLLVVGEDDDVDGFREPARRLHAALASWDSGSGRASMVLVPGMGHALAEEPGVEPAPQIPAAIEVDRHAVEWLRRHLVQRRGDG